VARLLLLGLLAVAPLALGLEADAQTAVTPADLWHQRIREAREWKLWIATAAAALLAVDWLLGVARRGELLARLRPVLLVVLTLATVYVWWHPYRGSLRAWLHVGDSFHYFIGAKYFDELGYSRLYHCAVIADGEAGLEPLLARSQIRNLETNELESARIALRDPAHCKRHFTPERWSEFSDDVNFFRSKLTLPLWLKMRSDHGYNPPPTWTMLGRPLSHAGPASRAQFFALTSLDPLLLAAMFGALAWAFGWRVMCIALLYWGTNQPASWEWVGGSIVRFDWLAASVAGVCCLKRGHPAVAGMLLAWAVGVRIFPIAIVGGLSLAALLRMIRERTVAPTRVQQRFAWSFAAGIAGIFALSSLLLGPRAWIDFANNSRVHLATDTVNRTGLRPLLAYSHEGRVAATFDTAEDDPYARWREERKQTYAARRPLFPVVAAAYLALLTFVLRRQPDWVAGVLGIGAVPVLLELGSYYFGVFLAFACLVQRREEVGVALLTLSAVSWWLGTWGGPDRDTLVAQTSLAMLLFVGFTTLRMRTSPSPARPGDVIA
jgi:hypothetical protein